MADNPQPADQADEVKKVAGVIVTHGHLSGELLAAAEMIIGPISHITAVSIGWHDDVDAARDEVGLVAADIDDVEGFARLCHGGAIGRRCSSVKPHLTRLW